MSQERFDLEGARNRQQEVVARFGAWMSHNMHLGGGLYTIDASRGIDHRLRAVVQIAHDLSGGRLDGLRVLDLGCFEGLFAIELARRGAHVVGIEGREANIAKARFVKEELGLARLELVCADVRDLSLEKHGRFDLILCLGLLYHLDGPDVFALVEKLVGMCDRWAIVDTHVSLASRVSIDHRGRTYHGRYHVEHEPHESEQERRDKLWHSIDNARSLWLTRASLINLLESSGFTSVQECRAPHSWISNDRVMLLAFKGSERLVPLADGPVARPAPEVPERLPWRSSTFQWPLYDVWAPVVRQALSPRLRRRLRKMLGLTVPPARGASGVSRE